MKKLSIVVPVYNVEKYLDDCMQSIYNQSLPLEVFEVIVVNDGSVDRSGDILKKYAGIYSNLVIIEQENQGQSVARNRGLEYAIGQYVFFMDSDDFISENSLGSLLEKAIENDLDILRFDYIYVDEEGKELNKKTNRKARQSYSGLLIDGYSLYENIYNQEFFCLSLLKREFLFFHSLQYLEGVYYEDVEYAIKLAYYAKRVMYVDASIYAYRQRSTSTIYTFNKKKIADIFYAISCLMPYTEDPVLSKRFRVIVKRNITNLMSYALFRIAEFVPAGERKVFSKLIDQYHIHYIYPVFSMKELIVSLLFNSLGFSVVTFLSLIFKLKKS